MNINELDAQTKKYLLQFCRNDFMWVDESNVPDLFKVLAEFEYVRCSWKNRQMIFYPMEKLRQACCAWNESVLDRDMATANYEQEQRLANAATGVDFGLL